MEEDAGNSGDDYVMDLVELRPPSSREATGIGRTPERGGARVNTSREAMGKAHTPELRGMRSQVAGLIEGEREVPRSVRLVVERMIQSIEREQEKAESCEERPVRGEPSAGKCARARPAASAQHAAGSGRGCKMKARAHRQDEEHGSRDQPEHVERGGVAEEKEQNRRHKQVAGGRALRAIGHPRGQR